MLSLSVWSIGTLAWQADVRVLAMRFSPRVPIRGIAAYVWVVVALNSAGWLTRIGPAIAHAGAPGYLRGTGLTTNVVYVQDLAWWLPLMALAAAWLWRRQPRGYLIVSAGLVMWVIESISIAVDQWYGHAADPASAVASAALVPAFAGIALIGLVPIYYLLRDFGHGQPASISGCAVPFADRRAWPAWMLAIVAAIVGAGAVLGGTQLLSNGYGMPLSWLSHTPLTSWLLPGLALLIGVAVPQLTVLALVTLANRWALFAGYLAGVALVAWIAVQLLVLQRYFFLQPVIACLGVLQVALARAWQRKTSGRSPRRTAAAGQAFGRLLVAIDRGTDVPAGGAMANRRIARGVVDALGALPFFVTAPLYRHWHLRWGATNEEAVGAMPGDELVPNPSFNATRAITIDAPPDRVWPWIVQMGYGRAGFYTYALLDNAGYDSADRILAEFQHPRVGDWMPMAKNPTDKTAFRVRALVTNSCLVWEKPDSTWAWTLTPDGEGRTRLCARLRQRYAWEMPTAAIMTLVLLEFGDFAMMRRVLRGIKARAERIEFDRRQCHDRAQASRGNESSAAHAAR
jgi:hypothetical protein